MKFKLPLGVVLLLATFYSASDPFGYFGSEGFIVGLSNVVLFFGIHLDLVLFSLMVSFSGRKKRTRAEIESTWKFKNVQEAREYVKTEYSDALDDVSQQRLSVMLFFGWSVLQQQALPILLHRGEKTMPLNPV